MEPSSIAGNDGTDKGRYGRVRILRMKQYIHLTTYTKIENGRRFLKNDSRFRRMVPTGTI